MCMKPVPKTDWTEKCSCTHAIVDGLLFFPFGFTCRSRSRFVFSIFLSLSLSFSLSLLLIWMYTRLMPGKLFSTTATIGTHPHYVVHTYMLWKQTFSNSNTHSHVSILNQTKPNWNKKYLLLLCVRSFASARTLTHSLVHLDGWRQPAIASEHRKTSRRRQWLYDDDHSHLIFI